MRIALFEPGIAGNVGAVLRSADGAGLDAVIVHPTGIFGPNDFLPSAMGRTLLDWGLEEKYKE